MSYLDDIRPHLAAVPVRSKAVLLALWAHADPRARSPVVWPMHSTIGEILGMDERTVRRAIRDLKACGALEKMTGRRVRLLRSHLAGIPDARAEHREMPEDTSVRFTGIPEVSPDRKPDTPDRIGDPLPDSGDQTPDSGDRVLDTGVLQNNQEHPRTTSVISPIRRPTANRAVATRPVGDDAGDPTWRVVLTEALALTPPGATAIRPYRQPPDGLTDVIAVLGVRGTCDMLRRYSALCREDPTQARWWSPGMFRPRRWAEIERRASAPLPSEMWTGVPGGPAKIAGPDDY